MKKSSIVLLIIITFFVMIFVDYTYAQENTIEADRPDQAESPNVIPRKSFQFEAGIVYERNKENGDVVNSLSYPSLLLRYGLLNNFELRMEIENVKVTTESNGIKTSINGISPVTLGFKTNVMKEKGIYPSLGLIVNFSLPNLASKNLKNNFVGSSFNLAFENHFTNDITLDYNLGTLWDGNTPEPTFFYTISFGYDISQRISGFIESYGFLPEKSRAEHRIDFGLSLFAKNNLVFDASAGFGITDNAPNFFVNGGFSYRIPR